MKTLIFSILKILKSDQFEVSYDLDVRRYVQLVQLMKFYNHDFDEKKYFGYGCNCLIVGKYRVFFIGILDFWQVKRGKRAFWLFSKIIKYF